MTGLTIRKPFAVLPERLTNISGGNARANRSIAHLAQHKYVGMLWESAGSSNLHAMGQFQDGDVPIDFASMMSANAGPSTTIRVRLGSSSSAVSGSGAAYDSGALPFINPAITRADGRYHSHLELDTPVTASWWRVDIGGHTGDFSACMQILGLKREPARFQNRDREIGFEDLGSVAFSRNGVLSDTRGSVLRKLLFRLQWVSDAEFWTQWYELGLRHDDATARMIYWCLAPHEHEYRQNNTFLGTMRPPLMKGNNYPKDNQTDFELRAIL